ncbi:MAG: type II toxin-antitoxin system VapC family toxin [Gemmatimonadota bacterium]
MILETTFLVDLERERLREERGPAHGFLEENASQRLCVTVTVAGELAAGASPHDRESWEELLRRLDILSIDREVCWRYGQIFRYLKDNGLPIGTNDLWIAATAVTHDLPLVTRNRRHFRRVPELRVMGYSA